MQYIILDDKKRPTHPFRDGMGAKTWREVKDFDNVGLIVPEPYIILDFDTQSDAEIMLNIIDGLNLQCRVMETTRGIHVWFKSEEPWKCFVKSRLACDIYCDCRSHSKNAYVKIKDRGVIRKWIRKCDLDEIEEVPSFLYPVEKPKDKFEFKGMRDGDGRNQELFNYIIYLQSKGFTREEIKECIYIVNTYVFDEPLEDSEIQTICREDAFSTDYQTRNPKKKEGKKEQTDKFSFTEFGDSLIKEFSIKNINGRLYYYSDGYYKLDNNNIENIILDRVKDITMSRRHEILTYIRVRTTVNMNTIKRDPYVINVLNTRINVATGELLEFTPEVFDFDRLPVIYNPKAKSEELDRLLERVFCKDRELINLFEEMVGYCLIKHNKYHKAFMLYGSGANGKSTIITLIKHFLGSANYKTIGLEKLTDRFAAAELENKLANIGDDINATTMKETGVIKKLFSGDELLVERKGQTPFDLKPYATMIFSANEIPKSNDKSYGLYRRWIFVPFQAKFTRADADYDPLIVDKILSEEAMSHMLNLALNGARRLIKNGGFTEPKSVVDMLEEYKTDNSNTLSWIEDRSLVAEDLLKIPSDELYILFSTWCQSSGISTVTGKKQFFKEIREKFKFDDIWTQRRVDNIRKRYFVVKNV